MAEAERTEGTTEDPEALQRDPNAGDAFFERSRLMVVAVDHADEGKLKWKAQIAPDGPWCPDWHLVNDGKYSRVAGGATADGRVALAAAGHGTIDYIVEAAVQTPYAERWDMPEPLGLPPGVAGLEALEMRRDAGGRIEVFAIDPMDGRMWWVFQNPPRIVERTEHVVPPGKTDPITVHVQVQGPPLTPWSAWQCFGDPVGAITVANLADGRIALFATGRGDDAGAVYRTEQTKAVAIRPDDWAPFTRLDDAASGPAELPPVAALDGEGALNIFIVGSAGQVLQRRQDPPGGSEWSAWARPGMTTGPVTALTTGIGGTKAITLLAVDRDGTLLANQQIDALRQQWSGWGAIACLSTSDIDLRTDYSADGRLMLFATDASEGAGGGGVRVLGQTVPEATSWEAAFTVLSKGLNNLAVVRDLTPPDDTRK